MEKCYAVTQNVWRVCLESSKESQQIGTTPEYCQEQIILIPFNYTCEARKRLQEQEGFFRVVFIQASIRETSQN